MNSDASGRGSGNVHSLLSNYHAGELSKEDFIARFTALGNEGIAEAFSAIYASTEADRSLLVEALSKAPEGHIKLIGGGLRDRSTEVRFAAAEALSASGSPKAAGYLIKASGDPVSFIRDTAYEGLVNLGEHSLPQLASALNSTDPDMRSTAERALSHFGRAAAPHLVNALRHGNDHAKSRASKLLIRLGPGEAEGDAEPQPQGMLNTLAFSDAPEDSRRWAVMALKAVAKDDFRATLMDCMLEDNPQVRKRALEALSTALYQDPAIIRETTYLLGDDDRGVQEAAIGTLVSYGDAALPELVVYFDDVSDKPLIAVENGISALSRISTKASLTLLVELMAKGQDPEEIHLTAQQMEEASADRMFDMDVIAAEIQSYRLAKESQYNIYLFSAERIAEIGEKMTPYLKRALEDPGKSPRHRKRAIEALWHIGNRQAMAAISEAMGCEDNGIAGFASETLASGKDDALDYLIPALGDENSTKRENAAKALDKMLYYTISQNGETYVLESLLEVVTKGEGSAVPAAYTILAKAGFSHKSILPAYEKILGELPSPRDRSDEERAAEKAAMLRIMGEILAESPNPAMAGTIVKELGHEDEAVREAAAGALKAMGLPMIEPMLWAAGQTSSRGRERMICLLEEMSWLADEGDAVVTPLERNISSDNPWSRAVALEARVTLGLSSKDAYGLAELAVYGSEEEFSAYGESLLRMPDTAVQPLSSILWLREKKGPGLLRKPEVDSDPELEILQSGMEDLVFGDSVHEEEREEVDLLKAKKRAGTLLAQIGDAALPDLKEIIWDSPDLETRRVAAYAVAQMGTKESLALLGRLMGAGTQLNDQIIAEAINLVGEEAIPMLTEIVNDHNQEWSRREFAVKCLVSLDCADSDKMDALLPMLSDPTPDIRREAARGLSKIGEASRRELVSRISEKLGVTYSPELARSAAPLMLLLDTRDSRKLFNEIAEDPEDRSPAALGLLDFYTELQTRDIRLMELASSPKIEGAKLCALQAIAMKGDRFALPLMLETLRSRRQETGEKRLLLLDMRRAAAEYLHSKVEFKYVLSEIMRLGQEAKDAGGREDISEKSLEALVSMYRRLARKSGGQREAEASDTLIIEGISARYAELKPVLSNLLLNSRNEDVKEICVKVICGKKEPSTIGLLVHALSDDSKEVRDAAAAALETNPDIEKVVLALVDRSWQTGGEREMEVISCIGSAGDTRAAENGKTALNCATDGFLILLVNPATRTRALSAILKSGEVTADLAGNQKFEHAVFDIASTKGHTMRSTCLGILMDRGKPDAIPFFASLLYEGGNPELEGSDPEVAAKGVSALLRLSKSHPHEVAIEMADIIQRTGISEEHTLLAAKRAFAVLSQMEPSKELAKTLVSLLVFDEHSQTALEILVKQPTFSEVLREDPFVLEKLYDSLDHLPKALEMEALKHLAELSESSTALLFTHLLLSEDQEVSGFAKEALKSHGLRDEVAWLLKEEVLQNAGRGSEGASEHVAACLEVLSAMPGPDAMNSLIELLSDPQTRKAAEGAIKARGMKDTVDGCLQLYNDMGMRKPVLSMLSELGEPAQDMLSAYAKLETEDLNKRLNALETLSRAFPAESADILSIALAHRNPRIRAKAHDCFVGLGEDAFGPLLSVMESRNSMLAVEGALECISRIGGESALQVQLKTLEMAETPELEWMAMKTFATQGGAAIRTMVEMAAGKGWAFRDSLAKAVAKSGTPEGEKLRSLLDNRNDYLGEFNSTPHLRELLKYAAIGAFMEDAPFASDVVAELWVRGFWEGPEFMSDLNRWLDDKKFSLPENTNGDKLWEDQFRRDFLKGKRAAFQRAQVKKAEAYRRARRPGSPPPLPAK